jgi:GNAT superfamily N-acetyltransferase
VKPNGVYTVAVCGSMSAYAEMEEVAAVLQARGIGVFLPEAEEERVDYRDLPPEILAAEKRRFIDLHLGKIGRSDAVLVVNPPKDGVAGYVGSNSLMELTAGYLLGLPLFLLNRPEAQRCSPELAGLGVQLLEGDLDRLGDPNGDAPTLRSLSAGDPEMISAAFAEIGWSKPVSYFEALRARESAGELELRLAFRAAEFAGYVAVVRRSDHLPFREQGTPEIRDLNVLPRFRGRGVGAHLMGWAERTCAASSGVAGLAVGLHPGYAAAHRLYARRGYIPDGTGVTYRGRRVEEGAHAPFDDDLLLWMTKRVPSISRGSGSGYRAEP